MPPGEYSERILRIIGAKGYQPRGIREIARAIGIGEDESGDFHAACKALMKTGRVVLGSSRALTLPEPRGRITGTYRANPKGFGFVIPDEPNAHGDLYVPRGGAADAITGDTVIAQVRKRGKRDGRMLYEGRIVDIVKRGHSRFVGELSRAARRSYVIPDGNTFHAPILVGDPGAKGARPGDKVVVEITHYPEGHGEARGVIVKVIGPRGRPDVDALAIVEQYGLPGDFPEDVLDAARSAGQSFDARREASGREDLRELTVITIDPTNSRDFDDAISLTTNSDGTCELGVHIADVAHFVREGTPLDDEARERGNSVYLPNMVIPMLPETLSNGVCSLQERQSRLTKSVFITFNRRGTVKKTRLANTITKSTKRLTYEQASRILEGKPGRTSVKIVSLMNDLEALARRIQARRRRQGMLTLELPEAELVHGDDGSVVDVLPRDTSYSHTIIEMFMVEANEAVARVLEGVGVPYLRRIHDEPSGTAWGGLARFLDALGHTLPDEPDRGRVQATLDAVRGKGESFAVNLAVLRSMRQAEYSPLSIGHYALASDDYCHFTSPIRRYPDLTVHRLIDLYLAGTLTKPTKGAPRGRKKKKGRRQKPTGDGAIAVVPPSVEDLHQLGRHCGDRERRAESAGRELTQVYVLRLLEKHIGDVFDGVVTGVANIGVYVQLTRYLIDGLLRFQGLMDDWWEVDAARGAILGERSGARIAIGDRLRVVVSRINLSTRQMDLALADPLPSAGKKPRGARGAGRKSGKTGRRAKAVRSPGRGKRRRAPSNRR